MEKLWQRCRSVCKRISKTKLQIFDWPPLASHAFMFAFGILVNFYQAEEPDLLLRLRPGEALLKPHPALKKKIVESKAASFIYFGRLQKEKLCLISESPISVAWQNTESPILAFRTQYFDQRLLSVLRNRSAKAVEIVAHPGLSLCEENPKLKY